MGHKLRSPGWKFWDFWPTLISSLRVLPCPFHWECFHGAEHIILKHNGLFPGNDFCFTGLLYLQKMGKESLMGGMTPDPPSFALSLWFKVYSGFFLISFHVLLFPEMHTLFFPSLFPPSFHLSSATDTGVSGVQTWLWFGFSKAMGHAGLFFPTVGFWVESLPSHAFSWACFTHTIDCRWCSGLSPADLEGESDTSLSEEEPLETGQKRHTVLSSLTLSSRWICQQMLWTRVSELLSTAQ